MDKYNNADDWKPLSLIERTLNSRLATFVRSAKGCSACKRQKDVHGKKFKQILRH